MLGVKWSPFHPFYCPLLNFKNISNIFSKIVSTFGTSQHYQDEGYCENMKLRWLYNTTNWLYHARKSGISLNLNLVIEKLKKQLC